MQASTRGSRSEDQDSRKPCLLAQLYGPCLVVDLCSEKRSHPVNSLQLKTNKNQLLVAGEDFGDEFHRLSVATVKGLQGDQLNLMLVAAAWKFRKWMRLFAVFGFTSCSCSLRKLSPFQVRLPLSALISWMFQIE